MTTSPVFIPMPDEGICVGTGDGAYYVAREDAAQIIVVGPMHFTPGDYFKALNDHLDTHFDLCKTHFMELPFDKNLHRAVLDRGFVSLIGKRNGHAR